MSLIVIPTTTNCTCNGSKTGSITLVISGGEAPYSYVWTKDGSPYSTDKDIYFLASGAYNVVVTDKNSLTGTTDPSVTEPAEPIPTLEITSAIDCSGSDGTIEATPPYGTGIEWDYLWSNGETTSSITVPSGNYSCRITLIDGGCTGSASIFLPDKTPITIEIEQTLEQCYEKAITLTANIRGGTPGTLSQQYVTQWSPNGETNVQSIQAESGTTYTISVQDFNGCLAARQIYVPTQLEAWQCCLGKQYARQAELKIKGLPVSNKMDVKLAILSIAINATTRFSRSCLTDVQQQTIKDYINATCNCGCGNVAATQEATPNFL